MIVGRGHVLHTAIPAMPGSNVAFPSTPKSIRAIRRTDIVFPRRRTSEEVYPSDGLQGDTPRLRNRCEPAELFAEFQKSREWRISRRTANFNHPLVLQIRSLDPRTVAVTPFDYKALPGEALPGGRGRVLLCLKF